MASIKDVAKEAGVSVATVSRVINKKGVCTNETQKLVYDTIEKLGYKPNLFGRALKQNETKIIMIMLSSLANTFCNNVIHSIDQIAEENGYCIMVCATQGNKDKEDYYLNFACNGFFDGIIILNSSLSQKEMSNLSENIPVVQCNEYIDTESTPFVSIDNEAASYDAVNMLIKNGRRNIVYFTVDNELISTKDRFTGYKKALEDNGIDFNEELVIYGNYGYRNASAMFEKFLEKNIPFDSIFAISDRMAAGAMSVLTVKGYKVPSEVEVIGFDNTDISYTSSPKITTVSQPHHELGSDAFNKIIKLINKIPTENTILPHNIIVRESTK